MALCVTCLSIPQQEIEALHQRVAGDISTIESQIISGETTQSAVSFLDIIIPPLKTECVCVCSRCVLAVTHSQLLSTYNMSSGYNSAIIIVPT